MPQGRRPVSTQTRTPGRTSRPPAERQEWPCLEQPRAVKRPVQKHSWCQGPLHFTHSGRQAAQVQARHPLHRRLIQRRCAFHQASLETQLAVTEQASRAQAREMVTDVETETPGQVIHRHFFAQLVEAS